jgi:hypothetical protein
MTGEVTKATVNSPIQADRSARVKRKTTAPSSFVFFTCLNCKALYQLVKVEAGLETTDRALTCLVCGAPLPGREGEFVLKYFLLRRASRGPRKNKLHQIADAKGS